MNDEEYKEDLNRRLQLVSSGDGNHLRNKARLCLDSRRLWPFIEDAIRLGKWKELADAMRRH
jgi:hypothetical protein